jgi:Family of unknown function (DUF5302)
MAQSDDQSGDQPGDQSGDQPGDQTGNDDIKARMREALERKQGRDRGVPHPAGTKQKAHGSEVLDGAPKVHRRKAGGGGS